MQPPSRPDRNIALELVRVTEAAALADVATLNTRRQAAALEGRAAGQTKQVKMPATQAATS